MPDEGVSPALYTPCPMASYYLILPAYNLILRLLVFAVEPVLGFHRHET